MNSNYLTIAIKYAPSDEERDLRWAWLHICNVRRDHRGHHSIPCRAGTPDSSPQLPCYSHSVPLTTSWCSQRRRRASLVERGRTTTYNWLRVLFSIVGKRNATTQSEQCQNKPHGRSGRWVTEGWNVVRYISHAGLKYKCQ